MKFVRLCVTKNVAINDDLIKFAVNYIITYVYMNE